MGAIYWLSGIFLFFLLSNFLISLWFSLYLCYLHNMEKRYLKILSTLHDVFKIKLGHEWKEADEASNITFQRINRPQQDGERGQLTRGWRAGARGGCVTVGDLG